ncbi:MAG: hypothetical protein SOZ59_02355 [Candidatus Limivivens sp.]|nr:hypothetical protein [Candidatus Limivivens sp.]
MTFLSGLLAAGIFCFLFTHPAHGLAAARYGLTLWFDTLVPTLLPFLMISGFCIQSGLLEQLSFVTEKFPDRLRKLSPGGTFALIAGFLCGFPTGAKILGDLRRNGRISLPEAQCLLHFCNNASPGFVFTYLIHEKLGLSNQILPILLLIYGIPLFCCGFSLLRALPTVTKECNAKKASSPQITFGLLDACIYDACITILKLGGYIILFSILTEMLTCLPFFTAKSCAVLTAVLELTSGIDRISDAFEMPWAILAAVPLTVFGGLCTFAQTISVLKGSGLNAGTYLRARAGMSLLAFAGTALWLLFVF